MADDLIKPTESEEINPVTGLPFKPGNKDQFNGKLLFTGINYKDPLSKYASYNVPLSPFVDLEEQRARLQTRSEKWRRGLLKAGVTTVGAVAENTVGLIDGAIEAAYTKNWNSLSNNAVGRTVDSANEWMRENYPNYVTEAERNMSAFEALGTANFWSDQVLNGLGYSLGSAATMWATGGTGLIARGVGLASKAAKATGAYNLSKSIISGTKAANIINSPRLANFGANLANAAKQTELGFMMSYAEASVEARETLKTQKRLIAEEYGVDPDNIPANLAKEINAEAERRSNLAFALNLGVLAPTNMIMFGKLMTPRYSSARQGISNVSVNAKTGQATDLLKDMSKAGRFATKYGKNIVGGGITESLQESSQYAISETVDDLSHASYKDIPKIIYDGYAETFGSKEGMESTLVGAIVGIITGGLGAARRALNSTEEQAQRDKIVSALNDPNMLNLFKRAEALGEAEEYTRAMQEYLEKGDHKGFRDMQSRLIASTALMHEATGSTDVLLDRLETAKNMPEAEFRVAWGIPEEVEFDQAKLVDSLIKDVKSVVAKKRGLDARFPSSRKQGVERLMMSKDEKAEEAIRIQEEELFKKIAVMNSFGLEDSESRIDNMINDVNEKLSSPINRNDFAFDSEVETQSEEYRLKIEENIAKIADPAVREEVTEKIIDLYKVVGDRDAAITALNELYKDPKSRASAIAREQKRQDKAAKDKFDAEMISKADDVIKTTDTAEELIEQTKGDIENYKKSDAARAKLKDEITKRRQEQSDFIKKLNSLPLSEVKALEGLTPLEAKIRDEYLQTRTEETPTGPVVTEPEDSTKETTEETKEPEESRGTKEPEETEDNPFEEDEYEGDEVTGNGLSNINVKNGKTRYVKNSEGKVIVDQNGVPLKNAEFDDTVNGSPVQISYELLASNKLVSEGTKVTLEVVETDWWKQNGSGYNAVTHIPIFIKKGDKYIGKLSSGNSNIRKAAVKAYREGNNGSVTTTVKSKSQGYRVNTVTIEGNPFFHNAYLTHGDSPVVIIQAEPETKAPIAVVYNNKYTGEEAAAIERAAEEAAISMVFGQVGFIVKNPKGEWVLQVAHTQNLSEDNVNEVINLMTKTDQDSYDRITYLIGNSVFLPGEAFQMSPTFWRADAALTRSGERIFTFQVGDIAYSIGTNLMKRLLSGEPIDFQKFKGTTAYYNLIQRAVKEGKEFSKLVNKSASGANLVEEKFPSDERLEEFINNELLDLLKTFLSNKKRNIDAVSLLKDPNYFMEITNEELPAVDGIEGYTGVLSTDATLINGSIFTDIEIKLDDVEEGKVETTIENPVEAPVSEEPTINDVLESSQDPFDTTDLPFDLGGPVDDGSEGRIGYDENGNEIDLSGSEFLPLRTGDTTSRKLDKTAAQAWLAERGIPVEFYDLAVRVGDAYAHGFMKDASVYLWNNAEVGTEYHEAFHYVFRTLLTDEQREAIYNEAVEKYGLKSKKPLDVEEYLAEKFRDYVLTLGETELTLPQKIKKFFKDLFNYIKALFRHPVEVDQLFSLIESNRIPRKFERQAESFSSKDPAYHLVKRSSLSKHYVNFKDLTDIIVSEYVDIADELMAITDKKEQSEYLLKYIGNGKDKGIIADNFLRRAISDREGYGMSNSQLSTVKKYVDSQQFDSLRSFMEEEDLFFKPPITEDVNSSAYYKPGIAAQFYSVYVNWNDVRDELGNLKDAGFRTTMLLNARKYGLKINESEQEIEIQDTEFDKIYNKSHLEESPTKNIGQDIRRIFSRVKNATTNSLGVRTYMDVDKTLKLMIPATVGARGYKEIVARLIEKAEYTPELKPLVEYLQDQDNVADAAKLTSLISLVKSNMVIYQTEVQKDDKGIVEKVTVKTINADAASNASEFAKIWRENGIQGGFNNPTALIKTVDGGLEFNNNDIEGASRAAKINEAIQTYLTDPAQGIADILWYSSIRFSPSKKAHTRRVTNSINSGVNLGRSAEAILMAVGTVERERRGAKRMLKFTPKEGKVDNVFLPGNQSIRSLSVEAAKYETPKSTSYISPDGKSKYPYNLPTPLAEMLDDLRTQRGLVEDVWGKDVALTAFGNKAFESILLRESAKNPDLFKHRTLDVINSEDPFESPRDHKKLSDRDYLILRINEFLNQGDATEFFYAIPTQEARPRTDLISLPRFDGRNVNRADVLSRIIVRDLIRQAKLGNEEYISSLSGIEDFDYATGKASEFIIEAVQRPEVYQDLFDAIQERATKYLNTTFLQNEQEFFDLVKKFNIFSHNGDTFNRDTQFIDDAFLRYSSVESMLRSYLFNQLVAKVEVSELFRGSLTTFNGNVSKFYKRAGLLDTPGNKPMMQGEFDGDPNYGMPRQLRTISIEKFETTDEWHNENSDNIAAKLKDLKVPNAEAIAKAYSNRNKDKDISDAQSYISPTMAKYMQQGFFGKWGKEDDAWFKEHMDNEGEWKMEYTPNFKVYYENHKLVDGITRVEMDKNSYVVLTKEFVEGNEVLEAMLDFMNKNNVHVINTESAKKGYAQKLYKIDQSNPKASFDAVDSIDTMRGDKIFMPQVINESQKIFARLNRQIRKNTFADVADTEKYFNLIEDVIKQSTEDILDKLGYNDLINKPGDRDARLKFLQNIRDLIISNQIENGKFDKSTEDQLQIITDIETQDIDFTLPLYFPAYQKKFESVLYSLFRNNVFKLNAPGSELVQVAGVGKFKIEDKLRELRHISVDENGNIGHAEVMVSQDFLDKYGLKVGDTGISYRIPHQGYSSTVPVKIVGVIPKSYKKTIIVPGNITVQTGSDFDIDKLFTLFPDKSKRAKNNKSAQLMNEVIRQIEKVSLSEEVFAQTIAPLNQDTLNEIYELNKDKQINLPFDHPLNDLQYQKAFKASQALVGAHANSLAGLSVAAQIKQGGVPLHDSKRIIVDDTTYGAIVNTSPLDGRKSSAITSERLNAALDAGTSPIQGALNENSVTANAITFLDHIGVSPYVIDKIVNHEVVRFAVDSITNSNMSANKVFSDLFEEEGLGADMLNNIRENNLTDSYASMIKKLKIVSGTNLNSDVAIFNFVQAYYGGRQLGDFYTTITADNADSIGNLGGNEHYLDKLSAYEADENPLVSAEIVRDILAGDRYRLQRAYFEGIKKVSDVMGTMFVGPNIATRNFKFALKKLVNANEFSPEIHTMIDTALVYHMLTKKGSPLGEITDANGVRLLDASKVKEVYANPEVTLESSLKRAVAAIPSLSNNLFISKLAQSPGYDNENNKVYGLILDKTEKLTEGERNDMIISFEALLNNPEIYTDNKEYQEGIRTLATKIALYSILSNGFAPTYGSYYDVIGVAFYNRIQHNGVTLAEHMRREFKRMQLDPRYFNEFLPEFIRNYGTRQVNGQSVVRYIPAKNARAVATAEDLNFYSTRNTSKGVERFSLFMKTSLGNYAMLEQKSIPGKLMEVNLRDANGDIMSGSIFERLYLVQEFSENIIEEMTEIVNFPGMEDGSQEINCKV